MCLSDNLVDVTDNSGKEIPDIVAHPTPVSEPDPSSRLRHSPLTITSLTPPHAGHKDPSH